MLATEMFEHSGAGSEEYRHEVNPDLIYQPRGDVLPTDFGATHHSNVLVPGGRLRLLERALDAVRDEGVHAPFGDGVGRFVGDDEHPGRWVRAVRAPKPDRVIVGTALGDDRSRAFHPAGEDLTVALVAAEPPLVQLLAAVAQRLLRGSVRGLHEPVERHAHVEDNLTHAYLLVVLASFVRRPRSRPSSCPRAPGCGSGTRTCPANHRTLRSPARFCPRGSRCPSSLRRGVPGWPPSRESISGG